MKRISFIRSKAFYPFIILIGIAMFAILSFLLGFFVQLLWNWLMPEIFGLGRISYLQSWGLLVLCHILFKAGSGPHGTRGGRGFGRHSKLGKKWREELREKIRRARAGYRGYGSDEEKPGDETSADNPGSGQ
jgi:hypothetical protein